MRSITCRTVLQCSASDRSNALQCDGSSDKDGNILSVSVSARKSRYAELGRFAGCTGKNDDEVFENFLAKLEDLKEKIGIKKSIKEYGIDEKYFLDTVDDMVEQAFNDQCTGANPRYPLFKEIKEIYLKCYYGK